MALRAYDPDRYTWRLHILADLEITEMFKKCQETDVCLFVNSFEDEPVSEVLLAVVDVRFGGAGEHKIYNLLARIPMLI